METNVLMKVLCSKCGFSTGVYANVGKSDKCPKCGGELVAAPKESKMKVIANFKCECGFSTGLFSSVGEDPKCPICGKRIN